MGWSVDGWIDWAFWLVVVSSAMMLAVRPEHAPGAVVPALLLALAPLARACRAARGTALGASAVWGVLAIGLGAFAEGLAISEPLATGRPLSGHVTYLGTLTALAALISVLNARTPGGGAWAILMSLLVVVFLIPWLEGAGLGRAPNGLGRLRLDNPWSLFFGLLVVAGVTNYLPTRYGPAAAMLGLGFVLEYLGLTTTGRSPASRAAVRAAVPWTLAAAVALADLRSRAGTPAASRLEAVWLWFRDHWGVVWALRVMERFNRTAEANGWPVRLAWQGVVSANGASALVVPDDAEATLIGLLRRFATPGRIDRAVADTPCQKTDAR